MTIKDIDFVRIQHPHRIPLPKHLEVLLVAVNLLDDLFQIQMLLLEDFQLLLKLVLRLFPLNFLEAVE